MKCPICNHTSGELLFTQSDVPLFQNIVYNDSVSAKNAAKSNVSLARCTKCSFVFNQQFEAETIDYQENYQNEQSHSQLFVAHLNQVYALLCKFDIHQKNVVEIGCGKGYFLELLSEKQVKIIGFDPAYEGNNPLISKTYFSRNNKINAQFIILRHTLEHIAAPLEFLHQIASANNYEGKIYIEVPNFKWIAENNAIEDIFYEHCNYFTEKTIANMFFKSHTGEIFEEQYIYVIADLAHLKKAEEVALADKETYKINFEEKLMAYSALIKNHESIAIWGAGAKGSTFLNLLDKNQEFIKCVIDINPRKQNKYIGGTSHPIVSPEYLVQFGIKTIIVMNKNYLNEIIQLTRNTFIKTLTLE